MLLCACGPAGLLIIDVSNPSAPVLAGTYKDGANFIRGVDASGSNAFVASSLKEGSSRLQILDLTTPSHPTLVASLDTPGVAQDVSVAGSLAYVTVGPAGMIIVDVSNPGAPYVCDSYRPYAHGQLIIHFAKVAASDSFVFVDNRDGPKAGLHILRYSPRQEMKGSHTCT